MKFALDLILAQLLFYDFSDTLSQKIIINNRTHTQIYTYWLITICLINDFFKFKLSVTK